MHAAGTFSLSSNLATYSPICVDYTKLMEERQANPLPDDDGGGMLPTANPAPIPLTQTIEVNVPGVNEVLRNALGEAQEGYKATQAAVMKKAKDDHKRAVRVT